MPIPPTVVLCERSGHSYRESRVSLDSVYNPLLKPVLNDNIKQELTKNDGRTPDPWADFVEAFRSTFQPLPSPWGELFGPLRAGTVDNLTVVAQIGQSLDGRIATTSGHSHYILSLIHISEP